MYFDHLIGLEHRDERTVVERIAVRGIIYRKEQFLLVELCHGQVMLAGGGIDKDETHEDALKREILEETGYCCKSVGPLVGRVLERREDFYQPDKLFEMSSYYYLAEPTEEIFDQQLEGYEKELEYKPVWLSLSEAVQKNEQFRKKLPENDLWILRDIYVLSQLQQIGLEKIKEML